MGWILDSNFKRVILDSDLGPCKLIRDYGITGEKIGIMGLHHLKLGLQKSCLKLGPILEGF